MDLEIEVKKLVAYIKSCGLQIPLRNPPHEHVGIIIADALLQVGHRWKTHVSPRLERMRDMYPNADTISGLSILLKTRGAQELLNWHGEDELERFRMTVRFFENEQVETFNKLREWLESDDNRDRLITKNSRIDKAVIPKIANATADYYRVLVGLPDAVKVDSLVQKFLADAGIEVKKYAYEEKRSIVQLAAKQLGKRPIDLDGAIWNYEEKRNKEKEKMFSKIAGGYNHKMLVAARKFPAPGDLTNEKGIIDNMARPVQWDRNKFILAVRGSYVAMWARTNTKERPTGWVDQRRYSKNFEEYLHTPEGSAWQKNNTPSWVPPTPAIVIPPVPVGTSASIEIRLSIIQKDKLQKFAGECGTDIPTIVQIWILERLYHLYKE